MSKQTRLGDLKDLPRRTGSDKVSLDKVFSIAKNLKYDRYQRGLDSMVHKFFDKTSSGCSIKTLSEIMTNQQ